jgi:hypothetical protein
MIAPQQGMMSPQQIPPQAMPPEGAPPQGMMSGAQPPQGRQPKELQGFTGTLTIEGKPVQVENGDLTYDGETVFVTADGQMVIDSNKQVIAYIENGEIRPMDNAHMEALKQQGLVDAAGNGGAQ